MVTPADDRRRRSLTTVWLVARREIRERTRRTAFRWSTVGLAALTMLAGTVAGLVEQGSGPEYTVAVVGSQTEALVDALAEPPPEGRATSSLQLTVVTPSSMAEAVALLRTGTAEVVVDSDDPSVVWQAAPDPALASRIDSALRAVQLRSAAATEGLPIEVVDEVLAGAPDVSSISPGTSVDPVALVAGIGAAVLLLASLTLWGNYLLMSVIEEKDTAVVEVLLGQVPARQLLAGKVLGTGLAALGQIGVLLAAAALALVLSGTAVPPGVVAAIPSVLVWFVLGFWLYATLYAAAGSLVSRQEDAGQAAAPITIVLVATYIVVFQTAESPDSTVATVLSLVPPLAPMLMPLRIATSSVALWEVMVAVSLLVLTGLLVLRLASRIYERSILQRGVRTGWADALRSR
ncbi:MAG: ABC transporter permease [Acidimicrobiia bacterium]|nr:ABC transporter permease [Acidimicrobiia bacterium]